MQRTSLESWMMYSYGLWADSGRIQPLLRFSAFGLSSIAGYDHDGVFLPLRRRRGQVGCAPVQVPDREPVHGDEVSRCRSSPPQVRGEDTGGRGVAYAAPQRGGWRAATVVHRR